MRAQVRLEGELPAWSVLLAILLAIFAPVKQIASERRHLRLISSARSNRPPLRILRPSEQAEGQLLPNSGGE
jgi:hypothetical protein